jgi:HEAT repeat protein
MNQTYGSMFAATASLLVLMAGCNNTTAPKGESRDNTPRAMEVVEIRNTPQQGGPLSIVMEKLESKERATVVAGLGDVPDARFDRAEIVPAIRQIMRASQGDAELSLACLEALATIGEKAVTAVPEILACLKSKNTNLRATAALVLAGTGAQASVCRGPLLKLLDDRDPLVVMVACKALAELGGSLDTVSTQKLLTLLDRQDDTALAAAFAIGSIGDGSRKVRDALWRAVRQEGFGLLRAEAAVALERFGEGKKVIPFLIGEFKSRENHRASKRALARMGTPAVPYLVEGLQNNPNPRIRQYCAITLGKIGFNAKSAIQALNKACEDTDPEVKRAATMALTRIRRTLNHDKPATASHSSNLTVIIK